MMTFLKIIFATFCTVMYISVFLTSWFLLCPIFFLRFLLGKFLNYLNPELDSLLIPASALLHQPRMNIVIKFAIDGRLSVEEMRDIFHSRVLTCKLPNGQLKYPELQQYVYNWCGFLFWKWDRKFSTEKHIRKLKREEKEFRNVNDLCQHLEETPMAEDKSPWEFLLLENPVLKSLEETPENRCIVIFRLRHSLADGHSIAKLLYGALSGQSLEKMPKSTILEKKKTFVQMFLLWIQLLKYFTCKSFQLFYNHKKFFDANDWHRGESSDKQKFMSYVLKPISMARAKEIQNKHAACLPSLIIAIIAGALQKTISQPHAEIPREIRICYPIPLKGHPDKLTNHFVIGDMAIPVGEVDPAKRLQLIRKNVELLKSGPEPLMNEIFVQIFGRLFHRMAIWITRARWVTMCLSNFPTPGKLILFGKNVSEFSFVNGIPNGNTRIVISCIGYNNVLQLVAQIENSLMETFQMDLISKYIDQELESLSSD